MQVIIDNEIKGKEAIDCVTSISKVKDDVCAINFRTNDGNKTRLIKLDGYTNLIVR